MLEQSTLDKVAETFRQGFLMSWKQLYFVTEKRNYPFTILTASDTEVTIRDEFGEEHRFGLGWDLPVLVEK